MEMLNSLTEIVKTYDGTEALRKDCRYIKGSFYIKNKQCFLIHELWYRINSPKIVFDYEYNEWILKGERPLITKGIVDIKDDGTIIEGCFSNNPEKNIDLYYNKELYYVLNESILLARSHLVSESAQGVYFFNKDLNSLPPEFNIKTRPRKDGYYSFPFNYGSDLLIPTFKESFDKDFKGENLLSDAYKFIEQFTFGVEFETEKGAIPERHLRKNGLIACRDGSITGFEYTTIPLHGCTGIQAIKKHCELLEKYCSCSPNESMHIHIGKFPRTTKAIASLYRLGLILQKEIYSMFPYYYTDTSNFKKKGYCNPLYVTGIQLNTHREIFKSIYYWLSNGNTFSKFPTGAHPMDRSGQHKWEISPRYIWINFIPLIWGNRGTVEFRCHTPTVKAQKVINWLFILVAILKYALSHSDSLVKVPQSELPKIKLKDILKYTYPSDICDVLNEYILIRKTHYSNKQDPIGEEEIISEYDYTEDKLIEFI